MIAVFGGCFNPPTIAHINIAAFLLEHYDVEKVIFLPHGNHYEKDGLADAQHRIEMLKLCIKGHDKLKISAIDVDSDHSLRTIEYITILSIQYPTTQVGFVIGSDNLKTINTWKSWERLISEYSFFVIPRGNDNCEEIINANPVLVKNRDHFTVVDNIQVTDISSTYIRNMLAEGKDPDYICPEVLEYIKANKLYTD